VSLTCPPDAAGDWMHYDVLFGYRIDSVDPIARVDIDYGDGSGFSNTSIDGVFEHRYTMSGRFEVQVAVMSSEGLADSAGCAWRLSL